MFCGNIAGKQVALKNKIYVVENGSEESEDKSYNWNEFGRIIWWRILTLSLFQFFLLPFVFVSILIFCSIKKSVIGLSDVWFDLLES